MTLKELRHKKGLSQAEAAAAIGVTQSAVSRWETGDLQGISPKNKKKLLKLYGVSEKELDEAIDAAVKTAAEKSGELSKIQKKLAKHYGLTESELLKSIRAAADGDSEKSE